MLLFKITTLDPPASEEKNPIYAHKGHTSSFLLYPIPTPFEKKIGSASVYCKMEYNNL